MDQLFHNLFRTIACLAIFIVVCATSMQPGFLSLSFFSQNNLELAEPYWEEGPQEEKQETDNEENLTDLNRSVITGYFFVYHTKSAIHNGWITAPKFISTIPIPPPERV